MWIHCIDTDSKDIILDTKDHKGLSYLIKYKYRYGRYGYSIDTDSKYISMNIDNVDTDTKDTDTKDTDTKDIVIINIDIIIISMDNIDCMNKLDSMVTG